MRGQSVSYSSEELAWVKAHKKMMRRKAHAKFCAKFDRKDVSFSNYAALCKRNGWLTGRTGRYEKGSIPPNKGKKMPYNANSAATQFKKGGIPPNVKYLGHERLTKDGYVEISVAERNPYTGYERRHVLKHRHLWEKVNGPIPEGMYLKCLDGNKQNTDPSNWECLPRSMSPRLSGRHSIGYDAAPPELKPTIMAIAKLEHQARVIKQNVADEDHD